MIRLLVKISILIDMNQFVVVHQINQNSATYVKKNIPSFQIAKTYKFILTKNSSQWKKEIYILKKKQKCFHQWHLTKIWTDFMQTIFRRLLRISYPLMVESTWITVTYVKSSWSITQSCWIIWCAKSCCITSNQPSIKHFCWIYYYSFKWYWLRSCYRNDRTIAWRIFIIQF